jgi:hypothetical protein
MAEVLSVLLVGAIKYLSKAYVWNYSQFDVVRQRDY